MWRLHFCAQFSQLSEMVIDLVCSPSDERFAVKVLHPVAYNGAALHGRNGEGWGYRQDCCQNALTFNGNRLL